MRISTSQLFGVGTQGIQRNQIDSLKTNMQISTGKRIVTPQDDPVGASQALVYTQAKEVNSNYLENQGVAGDQLKLTETKLNDVTRMLQSTLSSFVQAGNTTLNDANRQAIAKQLEVNLKELVGLSNTQDGTGNYLFSGYQVNKQPFVPGTTAPTDPAGSAYGGTSPAVRYMEYQGDQGVKTLQVEASRDMPVNLVGSEVFMNIRDRNGVATGRSMFDTMQNMIDTLNTPIDSNPNYQADYQRSLNELHANLDNVLRVRSTLGSQLNELTSLGKSATDTGLNYETVLSNLQDLDYTEAFTRLSRQQMQLQSSQLSFMKISSLNLFNYMS